MASTTTTTTTHNNNNNNFKLINVYKYKSQHRYSIDDAQLPRTNATTVKVSNTEANKYNQLIKSNSYCGAGDCVTDTTSNWANKKISSLHWQPESMIIPGMTSLPQTQPQSQISMPYNKPAATSTSPPLSSLANADADSTEYDAFLVNASSSNSALGASNSASNFDGSARRSQRSRFRGSCCLRTRAFITRNWYINYLVPITILITLMLVAYLSRDYAKRLLFWIETQNAWIVFAIYMGLFTLVSFPIVVGYFVLLVTCGYLFGCIKGWLTVVLGANVGIAIAHLTIRSLRHRLPIQRLIKNETGRAILRVISGPRAFKVVLFTRLTPIPFGLQNAIFGISSINLRDYHAATFLGLLPAQTINVYLGSTLRSMHEVLNNQDAQLTGYISFVFEVVIGIVLMYWVVQKARKELSETLLTDIGTEGKPVDMQV